MCAANQEKENMFACAQHIDSHIASAVGSVQGFMLLQSNGTLSSDSECTIKLTCSRSMVDAVNRL